jgi:hypothetical protein
MLTRVFIKRRICQPFCSCLLTKTNSFTYVCQTVHVIANFSTGIGAEVEINLAEEVVRQHSGEETGLARAIGMEQVRDYSRNSTAGQ